MDDGYDAKLRSKPFRFKEDSVKKESRRRDARSSSPERRHTRRRHHHRSRHPRRDPPKTLSGDDHAFAPTDHVSSHLPPDSAFRESLFDALGDDEGAAFWERVYGQPVHNYQNTQWNLETGELERMTDDDYVAFVRRKMWEKSREGIETAREEERIKRKKEKEAQTKQNSQKTNGGMDYEQSCFNRDVDAALRRGCERNKMQARLESWKAYQQSWFHLDSLIEKINDGTYKSSKRDVSLRDNIAWPVFSRQWGDVNEENVELFMKGAAGPTTSDQSGYWQAFTRVLKGERIRWHPDKIQQRYGAIYIDDQTRRGVTTVFQILDELWNRNTAFK
ncbi:MAG: hypothetical protein Q9160_002773 [Pyrenula sp. 1 TL-2023]